MTTVQAQCGVRSCGGARRSVDRSHLRPRVGGDGRGVERRVLDVVAHRDDVLLPHRLDVHQRPAVVEPELSVPRVVHGVAEVHELRWRPDVELEPLEDGDDVTRLSRGWAETERALHPAGVDRRGGHPLLDRDLGHPLPSERLDGPRHPRAVDQVTDQQQLGHQPRQLVAGRPAYADREAGVSRRSARRSSTAPAAPSCPACRARSGAVRRSRSPAWGPARRPCVP